MLVKLLVLTRLLLLSFTEGQATTRTPINQAPTLAQKVSFLAYTAKYGKSYSSTSEFNIRFKNWLATD